MIKTFKNEEYTNFADQKNLTAVQKAIELEKSKFGTEYPSVINGEKIYSEQKINSINPSEHDQVIGYASSTDYNKIEEAVDTALRTFNRWKYETVGFRARCLLKAAAIMRSRKPELTATMILEAGKSWAEADGDVAEAIDFLEFYAIRAFELAEAQPLTRLPGEDNELYYIPLGVGVIISPWNFPLAILTGMTAGPLVMGNTVIVKPASNTPVIAARFMDIMEDAGVPKGVINLVYGSGSKIGNYLVKHPMTRFINFTGSKEVGLSIIEEGSKIREGQIWIKRVSAEMGGKDAIIVDQEVDLSDAVTGVITSAFGFQGQKCSACSRAVIDEKVYDQFLDMLIKKVKDIKVGPAEDINNYMGPLIDQDAVDKVLRYIEIGKNEGELLCGGKKIDGEGYFIEPTVFGNIRSDQRLAQEEIFGPVLALIKSKGFEHSLQIANNTVYGLTGSVYSKNRANLEKAREELFIGNLYFNRKCTGAMVGAHPFGGYNMSGTCAKAGGKDYLLLFSQAKSVVEKLPPGIE